MEASRTVDMAQESENGQRDVSNNSGGDPSLDSKFEKSFPEESKKASNEIVDQGNQNNNGSSSSNDRTQPKIPKISESKPPSNVYGFGNEELALQKLLSMCRTDDHLKPIGVVGITGVGKTTLCQSIYHNKDVKTQFVPRIWVCMSRQENEDNINFKVETVTRILERLGIYQDTLNSFPEGQKLDALDYILHQQLIGKRYLIVLDYFEDVQVWKHLSNVLPKGYGGKVIVTGRNEKFIKEMAGEENLHQLGPLSEQESCWLIYRDSVRAKDVELNLRSSKELEEELEILQRENPPNTKRIEEIKAKQREQKKNAEEIKRKCGGIPLAAKLLGEIKAEEKIKIKEPSIPELDVQTAAVTNHIQQTAVIMNA